jgi:hypothetical protein
MRQNHICIGVLLAVLAWPGSSDLFMHDLGVVADAYYDLGSDNNYIDMELMASEQFQARQYTQAISLQYEHINDLIASLGECVFMVKGAYGEHMEQELQSRIANAYAQQIYRKAKNSESPLNVFKVDQQRIAMSSGLFGPECVFGIEYDGQVLLMQAAAMD